MMIVTVMNTLITARQNHRGRVLIGPQMTRGVIMSVDWLFSISSLIQDHIPIPRSNLYQDLSKLGKTSLAPVLS